MEKIFPKKEPVMGIRVVDGEVIGEITITADNTTIKNPWRVMTGRGPKGDIVVDIFPYTLLTDTVIFPNDKVVCHAFELDREMLAMYYERALGIAIAK